MDSVSLEEVWLPVVGYEGLYEISSLGRLKILEKTFVNNGGLVHRKQQITDAKSANPKRYLSYQLTENTNRRTHKRSRLVAIAHIPNPLNKPEVNHKDGNKQNDCKSNLEWSTTKENSEHAWLNGLAKPLQGEDKPTAKLKSEDIAKIREIYSTGKYNQTEVGKMFGVCRSAIGQVVNNKTWVHIK